MFTELQTMPPATTTPEPQPTPLAEWLEDFRRQSAALQQAANDFRNLCERIPRPLDQADTQLLMAWRKSIYLPPQQATADALTSAAKQIAQPLHNVAFLTETVATEALQNLEGAMSYLADRQEAGLVSPAALPEGLALVDPRTGDVAVSISHIAMAGHAITAGLDDDEVTHQGQQRYAHLGRAINLGAPRRWRLHSWATLALCRGLGYAARQVQLEEARDAEITAGVLTRQADALEESRKTPSERLVEVERELARLKERS